MTADHVHHDSAEAWLASTTEQFATCPITEGSLIRQIVREGETARRAAAMLRVLIEHPRHEFWPDALSYRDVSLDEVVGHGDVTDAYLVALARAHGARLATFDRRLAAAYPDAVELVPTA